jgi:hypothetical protein
MSMKVFYAYLFKENAEFGDLDKARAYLADLREKFIEWVPKDMIRWEAFRKDINDTIDVIKAIEKDTKDPLKGGVWDYQLQATVFAKTMDGVNYIAIQFFPSNAGVKFLRENVKLREFWYENQTDDGFDLPDYPLREKFWETVYDGCGVPSELGFSFDIYDGTNFRVTETIATAFCKLRDAKREKEKSNVQED